jgi:hypothetical protein
MKVVIAGGTGFLGRPLARGLAADGHEVVVLTRGSRRPSGEVPRFVAWTPEGSRGDGWRAEIEGAEAVVNLAGEPIAGRRWSNAHKQRMLTSRVQATRAIADAIRGAKRPPRVLISSSAVGYYGPLGDEVVTEEQPAGVDFLATICKQWEAEAVRAASDSTRVVCIRTGLVLEKDGGALPPMLITFKLGLGARVGSGRQYWPWIHRLDWLALVRWCLDTPEAAGPFNATAPAPATNREFTQSLARSLQRPAFIVAPAFALRVLLGEMADALLLAGQRAIPAKAERLGFRFRYTSLDEALDSILRKH